MTQGGNCSADRALGWIKRIKQETAAWGGRLALPAPAHGDCGALVSQGLALPCSGQAACDGLRGLLGWTSVGLDLGSRKPGRKGVLGEARAPGTRPGCAVDGHEGEPSRPRGAALVGSAATAVPHRLAC